MPELLEFQEVIETHAVVLAVLCGAVAVLPICAGPATRCISGTVAGASGSED